MAVALDSNVIVYAFSSDAAEKQARAVSILGAGGNAGTSVTLQAVGDVFSVLTRRKRWSAADARSVVASLIENVRVIEPTTAALLQATQLTERHMVSFRDALMVCVAAEGGCTSLLSEDLQNGRRFSAADAGRSIRIVDPFDDANLPKLIAEGLVVR